MVAAMIMVRMTGIDWLLNLKTSILHLLTLGVHQSLHGKILGKTLGPINHFWILEDTPFDKLQEAIDSHSHIFVTADSTSMIVEILTRGYFVNVIELRGPIKRTSSRNNCIFCRKGFLKMLRLNQLHLSEDKYQEKVKEFVVAERDALKSKVLDLL